ncbi:biological adhesion [Branchiostoma belcheri]|nr:biological adhesion [Branchiostoma belcheri]
MVPFRQKMVGKVFEDHIICKEPSRFLGRKLRGINPDDLTCEEPQIVMFKMINGNRPVLEGDTIFLMCDVSGIPSPDITVTLPSGRNATVESGGRVTVEANGTIIIQDIAAVDSGLYVCLAASPVGSTSANLSIYVQGPSSTPAGVMKPSARRLPGAQLNVPLRLPVGALRRLLFKIHKLLVPLPAGFGQSPVLTFAGCGRVTTGSFSLAGQLFGPWRGPGVILAGPRLVRPWLTGACAAAWRDPAGRLAPVRLRRRIGVPCRTGPEVGDLTWDEHVKGIISKVQPRIHYLRLARKSGLPSDVLLSIYTSFIRPVMEYGSPVGSDTLQLTPPYGTETTTQQIK